MGKRDVPALRDKVKEISRDLEDGIDTIGKKMTVCLKREIFSQQNHFKNCDFTCAEFFDDEGEKLLRIMGTVVDEM